MNIFVVMRRSMWVAALAALLLQGATAFAKGDLPPLLEKRNVHGMWWAGPAEAGWGIYLSDQGEELFASWFTYDLDGSPMWIVMPDGHYDFSRGEYRGPLYRGSGPAFNAEPWDASAVQMRYVGEATLRFDSEGGDFSYTFVSGQTQRKRISRYVFGSQEPQCVHGAAQGSEPNYTDMWWHPAGIEAGWALDIDHQGELLFAAWFTYGDDGADDWLVIPVAVRISESVYSGRIYRMRGPPYDARPWSPALVTATDVGNATLYFADRDNGTFSYVVDAIVGSKLITRYVFARPASACQ
jgi:hypothetical protein